MEGRNEVGAGSVALGCTLGGVRCLCGGREWGARGASRFPPESDAGRSRALLEKGLSLLASTRSRTAQATTSRRVKPKKAWIISKGRIKFPYQASLTLTLLKPGEVCLRGRTWVLL